MNASRTTIDGKCPRLLALPTLATLFAALALCGLAGCSMPKPEAKVVGVRFDDLSLKALTLLFDVEVYNPYALDMPLIDVDYRLSSGGASFLSGSAPLQGTVPAKQRKTVALPARIVYADLIKAVRTVRPGMLVPYQAEMGLSANLPLLGRQRLPIQKEGELPVPAMPRLEVQEVAWKLGLQETRGDLRLRATNTNPFALSIRKMGLTFELGGVDVGCSGSQNGLALPANGQSDIPLFVSASPAKLGLAVVRLISGEGGDYRLKGALEVDTPFGPLSLPVDSPGKTLFRRAK